MRKAAFLIFIVLSTVGIAAGENHHNVADRNFYYKLYSEYRDTDFEKALPYAEDHLERVDSLHFSSREAAMLEEMAKYYQDQKYMFSKSIELLTQAMEFYEASEMKYERARCCLALADLNQKIHNYDRTLEYCNMALQFFRADEEKYVSEILSAYNLLGIVHIICNDTEMAKKYFQEQSRISAETNDKDALVLALNNLASIDMKEGDTMECETFLKEAVELSGHNQNLKFRSLRNLAVYYYLVDSMSVFESLLDSLAVNAVKIDDKAEYHSINGIALLERADTLGAISEYKMALEQYRQGEFRWKEKQMLYELSALYKELNDIEQAYFYLSEYNQIETNKDDMMFQRLFSYQNRLNLQKERAEQESRKTQLTYIIAIVIFVCLVVVSAITIIYLRKYYRIQQAELELENKKLANEKIAREINSKQYQIEKKRLQEFKEESVISTIYENLKSLNAKISDTEAREQLNLICKDLIRLREYSEGEEGTEAEPYLPEFNPELMKNLSASFPNLSMNERRLCALLSLNMSTKEISDITKQSPNSINVSRYRLRKKLGINNSDISIHKFLDKYN